MRSMSRASVLIRDRDDEAMNEAYGPSQEVFDAINKVRERAGILTVEEACWAGGEPIITEEHYKILDFWIENDIDVRLRYTTNFSNLYFKKKSILEYWNSFKDVRIAASLDAMGARGELIRAGTNWNRIEKNRISMIEECPDVYFEITPTVSIMNRPRKYI